LRALHNGAIAQAQRLGKLWLIFLVLLLSTRLTLPFMRDATDPIKSEPKPGEWMSPEEFENVIRLTPLVAIDVVVHSSEDRVLVGRRLYEPAKDLFFVPGGRITKNETLAAAFRRITREELGTEFALEHAKFLGVNEHMYSTNRFSKKGFGTHYITLAYEIRASLDMTLLPKDQHGEYAWLSQQELLVSAEVHENTKVYFR
jgi:GDP-mannose mannosyl hydrolase